MNTINITCPQCGEVQSFTTYPFLQCDHNFDIRFALMSKEYFTFLCDNCQHQQPIIYPMVYHDEDLELLVALVPPNDTLEKLTDESVLNLIKENPYLITRQVKSDNELYEKIIIAQSELDDRLVELVKEESRHFIENQEPQWQVGDIFINRDKEGYFLSCFLQDGQHVTLAVDPEVFTIAKRKYDHLLSRQNTWEFMKVDRHWANNFVEHHLEAVNM